MRPTLNIEITGRGEITGAIIVVAAIGLNDIDILSARRSSTRPRPLQKNNDRKLRSGRRCYEPFP